ncbi:MAG: STAS domain-containing protein [Planctomycetota bacterium]
MPSSYKIAIYPQNVATIAFCGALEGSVVQKAVEECLNRQCYSVVIDLADVSHAPSNAIATFISLKAAFDARGGRMLFLEIDGTVKIVLDMMGFGEVFRFAPDLNTALVELIDMSGTQRRVSL